MVVSTCEECLETVSMAEIYINQRDFLKYNHYNLHNIGLEPITFSVEKHNYHD